MFFVSSDVFFFLCCLSSVQFNVRVHHTPDTSVVIQPMDQSDVKPPYKMGPRLLPSRLKPKGRCFQETTPKQAVSLDPESCCSAICTDNVSLAPLASVQQHAASRSDQSGGLLRQCGEFMGTKQVLSVPQTTK